MYNKTILVVLLPAFFLGMVALPHARAASSTVIFSEPGFPAVDSPEPSASQLQARFGDGSAFKEIAYGKGRIFRAAYPVAFGGSTQAVAELYAYVSSKVGIQPAFELLAPLSPGVLVYPTVLNDSVLYVMISDNADNARVDFRDKLTGARIAPQLAGQHAAIAVAGKIENRIVAKYGF